MGNSQKIMNYLNALFAFIWLIILIPLFLIISIILLILQGPPIFFTQERVGIRYQMFDLYKFRTMVNNEDSNRVEGISDSRITPLGSFLRMLKIDELPQLVNIIKGDINFVGPRPELPLFINQTNAPFLKTVKPGLTDYSSILLRDENMILSKAGGPESYRDLLKLKLKLCQIYSERRSFTLDIKLIIITIVSLIFPKTGKRLVLMLLNVHEHPSLYEEINVWLG